ncbi:MAG: hypothetical protein ABIE22_02990 [archaeon]
MDKSIGAYDLQNLTYTDSRVQSCLAEACQIRESGGERRAAFNKCVLDIGHDWETEKAAGIYYGEGRSVVGVISASNKVDILAVELLRFYEARAREKGVGLEEVMGGVKNDGKGFLKSLLERVSNCQPYSFAYSM